MLSLSIGERTDVSDTANLLLFVSGQDRIFCEVAKKLQSEIITIDSRKTLVVIIGIVGRIDSKLQECGSKALFILKVFDPPKSIVFHCG